MTTNGYAFNSPPGWPLPPRGWYPPEGWKPDPAWPAAPADWAFWVPVDSAGPPAPTREAPPASAAEVISAGATPPEPEAVNPVLRTEEAELFALRSQVANLQALLTQQHEAPAATDVIDLDDERVLQEVGIYRYHHPLDNSEEFKGRLRILEEEIKSAVKRGDAVLVSDMFTFNNSLAKGRKMSGDFSKLMLRAYNAEADSSVRSLRAGNVITAKKRLEASVTAIAKLGSMMELRISPTYHQLRIQELELTGDFLMKVQEEKEAAREERERLREERKAEQELTAERERLEKERAHFVNALNSLKASGDVASAGELADKLAQLDKAIADNDYRIANIRAGYVYVISNAGAFGPNMVKIGLTRRLEPLDRVRELGDASVPFPFDIHALFFSEDAVTLETELHHAFSARRVNHVNQRREFFFATPAEVHVVLTEKVGNLLEFTEHPEATQYLQSKGYWPGVGAEK